MVLSVTAVNTLVTEATTVRVPVLHTEPSSPLRDEYIPGTGYSRAWFETRTGAGDDGIRIRITYNVLFKLYNQQ